MLTSARGLTDAELDAIAGLERRVLAVDGGRLKLEWGTLRGRPGERVEDLLRWQGDQLIGFVGLYQFGGGDLELAGMVDPAHRREGIGTRLLTGAVGLARERGLEKLLLVTPRSTAPGRLFALARGAVLEHSEHHLVLGRTPPGEPSDPEVAVRPAVAADLEQIRRVLAAAFGPGSPDVPIPLDDPAERQLVIERTGVFVGTVRLGVEADGTGIYGFAVDPARQGRGIGREVLRRVCRQLRSEGVEHVTLEVAVDNDRALGLYTSVGFEQQATEDYYELQLGA